MSQDSFWDMEVEAENQTEALTTAFRRAIEGGAAKDRDREWGDFTVLSAIPLQTKTNQ